MNELDKISNTDIVLYALYRLGGATKKVHTEYIAWEAYKFAKEKFSWSLPKFRDKGFPDKTTARYALESAKKIKYITGRAGKDKGGAESEGWKFTSTGVKWMIKNEKKIAGLLENYIPISATLPQHKAERFIKKIKSKKIFVEFKKSLNLKFSNIYDFVDMLNCSPDAHEKVLKNQFDQIKTNANLINDKELKKFVNLCEKKFDEFLNK